MDALHLRLQPTKTSLSKQKIVFEFPHVALQWDEPHLGLHGCLERLLQGAPENELSQIWEKAEGDLAEFYYLLETIKQHGILHYTLFEKEPILTLTAPNMVIQAPEMDKPIQLSRFAYLRTHDQQLLLESPLAANTTLEIHQPDVLPLLGTLAKPTLPAHFNGAYSPETRLALLTLLHSAAFTTASEEKLAMPASWEFHDLLFHSKSRKGRSLAPKGATFRFLEKTAPLPPTLPPFPGATPLYRPNLDHLAAQDPTFTSVLEKRASIRTHSSQPISQKQLGEFLYRAARIKQHVQGQHYQATKRPYPGGGACYEIEIFPLVHRCEGLPSAIYHYDADRHALASVSDDQAHMESLLQYATQATGQTNYPQILFLLAARFHRVAWKYESIAYAIILKNAGALIQTFYLVATAMDLAPCAIGCGDSDLFAKATHTNYYEMTTVAEFMLGRKV